MNHHLALPEAWIAMIQLLPPLLVGGSLLVSGHVRRGVLFGVSVPLDYASSPDARRILRNYRISIIVPMALAVAAVFLPFFRGRPWLGPAGVGLVLLGAFAGWFAARGRVVTHAVAHPVERRASLAAGGDGGEFLGILPLAILPLAGAWFYLRAHWNKIPARFPRHWNAAGAVNGWSSRTPGSVGMPLLIGLCAVLVIFSTALFVYLAPTVERSLARRIVLPILTVIAWMNALLLSMVALLPLIRSGERLILSAVAVQLSVIVALVAWMIWRLMQTQGAEAYDATPDACWYAGLFYYNPADAAVFVPKRFGYGWTMNFARPSAWWMLGAILLFSLLSVLFAFHARR